ncbi:MAG: DUF2158 domain-containing protein [Pseudomonadota bacterium]
MKETSPFTKGDKVRLKTGGQIMTVEASPDHMAYCVWFVQSKPYQGTFHTDSIELVLPADDVPDSRFGSLR